MRTVPPTKNYTQNTPAEIPRLNLNAVMTYPTTLHYPTKIGIESEQPHWLKIEIRVREETVNIMNSRVSTHNAIQTTGAYNEYDTKGRRVDARDAARLAMYSTTVGASSVGSSAVGAIGEAFPIFSDFFGSLFKAVGAVVGGAVGVVAGFGGDVAQRASGTNGLLTLKSVIGLGLQAPPSISYSSVWEAMDMGEFVVSGGSLGSVGQIAAEALRNQAGVKGALGNASGTENLGEATRKAQGKLRNPYREQIFKQVEFRTVTFNYTFLPESIQEAETVLNIIKLLKQHMLQTFAPEGYYLVYPSEFSLTYMYSERENTYVNKILDCVLTDMSVTYGSQDFTTFRDTAGKPSEIHIVLSFKEIVTLTGDQIFNNNY
jgi:hypothetical protein